MKVKTPSAKEISKFLSSHGDGPNILLLGTCDTKLHELLHLRQRILDAGAGQVSLADVGKSIIENEAVTVRQDTVATYPIGDSKPPTDLGSLSRGEVVKHMSERATHLIREVYSSAGIHAVISAGGSTGTSLVAAVMREALPIGFPKLLISTIASGDTSSLVGETDITMTYSVVDIAGENSLLRSIFANAAGAVVGMARAYQRSTATETASQTKKRKIGITMFGVTTPCVDACRDYLQDEHDCEVFVFHATGHGGKAMERLVESGELDAVLDMTTTELCDELMGGNMSAGPHRMEAAPRAGIPYVVSLGATSMVNFGPRSTVPERYSDRKLYEHNPTVTLMRTSEDECRQIGGIVADKLKSFAVHKDNVKVVIPAGGVCMISTPGGPFADSGADEAMFAAVEAGLEGSGIQVFRDGREINDTGFARDTSKRLVDLLLNHVEQ